MSSLEILLDALNAHQIEIISLNNNNVTIQDNYEIELEANGIYRLLNEGYIVAPFNDVDALCRFILT